VGFHLLAIRYLRVRGALRVKAALCVGALRWRLAGEAPALQFISCGSRCRASAPLAGKKLQFKKGPQTVQEGGPIFAFLSLVLAVGNRFFQ
jgi:hypothetical protein